MTKEEFHALWDGMTDEKKQEVEQTYKEKRKQLFKWHEEESEKINAKLKEEGRFRIGLDVNNTQPEVMELSAEYRRRLNSVIEECVCAAARQQN